MPQAKISAPKASRPKATAKKTTKAAVLSAHRADKKKNKKVIVDVIADEPIFSEEAIGAGRAARLAPDESDNYHPSAGEIRANRAADDLDSQKKFFSSFVAAAPDVKEHPAKARKTKSAGHSLNLYRRLVIKFIVFTVILLAVVIYFSLAKLTVIITPQGEDLNDSLLLRVAGAATLNAAETATGTSATTTEAAADENLNTALSQPIKGLIQNMTVNLSKTYPATGEDFAGQEISGQVTIVNHYTKTQALVATTRLLSPDNKLFRLKNAVTIPAGGEATAAIYADKPTEDLAIGPTTFTIPGLWLGIQDKIYAKSETAFTFNRGIKKYVKPSDLQAATDDIKTALLAQAKSNLSGGDWLYDTSAPATISVDAKANDAKDQFMVIAQEKIVAISFDKEAAAKLAAAKLDLLIPDDKELAAFDPANIDYSLDNYDPLTNTAIIKANFSGTMVLKNDATIIDRKQLVNLTKDQLDTYLKTLPDIKNYELKFSPGFIKKAPSLADRIKVEIKK